jgi:hypothetical protein
MTHRSTLERWTTLLRPLFPHHAEFDLQPRLGHLRAKWPPRRAVAIFIAPNALQDYREAEERIRTRADENLLEFVKENLRQFAPEHDAEFRIVVASIDFVPLSNMRGNAAMN